MRNFLKFYILFSSFAIALEIVVFVFFYFSYKEKSNRETQDSIFEIGSTIEGSESKFLINNEVNFSSLNQYIKIENIVIFAIFDDRNKLVYLINNPNVIVDLSSYKLDFKNSRMLRKQLCNKLDCEFTEKNFTYNARQYKINALYINKIKNSYIFNLLLYFFMFSFLHLLITVIVIIFKNIKKSDEFRKEAARAEKIKFIENKNDIINTNNSSNNSIKNNINSNISKKKSIPKEKKEDKDSIDSIDSFNLNFFSDNDKNID